MDVVGSEIGQKMRSAIKAKLTELGCYVDDELPDYVMVMVANKRTRAQMEDDLQLFLGDNTELFVNWLHQVLKKLQEVQVAAPKPPETVKNNEKERSHSKDRKSKEKKAKDKTKKSDLKKAKKKEKVKEKSLRKKELKKAQKKKKIKDQEIFRPNIPPLLMNMEKDSEPSITDAFEGRILKNHGILYRNQKEDPKETKPILKVPDAKRPIVPIIDPATIDAEPTEATETIAQQTRVSISSTAPREEQLKEMTKIEAKIQGLKQKLVEQLDSMSEDEDFLNIRTEAEELMNDFAEDVFQEISDQTPVITTPPPQPRAKFPTPPPKSQETPKITPPDPIETLPQIELKLPKRPIRERLGTREEPKRIPEAKKKEDRKVSKSPESFTPERELVPPQPSNKSSKSRTAAQEHKKIQSSSETSSEKPETTTKRLTSRVSVLEHRSSGRATCASVVRVRPRPRVAAPASNLLLRAVADAQKSLLNIPPKVVKDSPSVKRALVLPMRRVDAQKIVISVPGDIRHDDGDTHDTISLGDPDSDDDKNSKVTSDTEKDEYVPSLTTKSHNEYVPGPLIMKIHNTDYVHSRRLDGRTATRKDDSIVIETINIHNPTLEKDKNTKFIVTMDGFNPNAFLTKKLQTEGLLTDDDEDLISVKKPKKQATTPTEKESYITTEVTEKVERKRNLSDTSEKKKRESSITTELTEQVERKRHLTDTNEKKKKASSITTEVIEKVERKRHLSDSREKEKKESSVTTDTEKVERKRHLSDSSEKEKNESSITTEVTEKVERTRHFNDTTEKRKAAEKTEVSEKINESEKSKASEKNIVSEKSDGSEKSDVIEIIETEIVIKEEKLEEDVNKHKSVDILDLKGDSPPTKKRKSSPIVFDVGKKEKEKEKIRERTESVGSDNHVTVTTTTSSHKYDALPPLSTSTDKKSAWCRAFPLCRYGAACAFLHPRCKFAAGCTRRSCPYSHALSAAPLSPVPVVASHVVPAANYKTISATPLPAMCKYYPACANPACHFYHPKPCRYGKMCVNKLECNFYHADVPASKWRYTV